MRSVHARYKIIQRNLPSTYSSYICFARAIKHQRFSYELISKWFNKLVDKEDYRQRERNDIVVYLHRLSNTPEEKEF